MTRNRGPELSKDFKDYIFNQWMFFGMNAYQIANKINGSTELMSKFGKATPAGIHYHIIRIREDLENTISEDAMDTYIGEFIRGMQGYEQDVESIDILIEHEKSKGMDQADKDIIIKLMRLRHEVKTDKFKMLQDSALPLQIKKLKLERNKYRPKPQGELEVVDEGVSEQGDSSTNQ